MADKKMTQIAAFETIAGVLNAMNDLSEEEIEALEVLKGVIETRKNRKATPRKNPAAEAFREYLAGILGAAEGPLTNAEIVALVQADFEAGKVDLGVDKEGNPVTKVSPQKVANNIRVMEKAGTVIRHEDGKNKTFSIA